MAQFTITIKGLAELRKAIQRNPQNVLREVRNFLTESLATYRRGIIRSPWKMGSEGGGSPVSTGNLRDTHRTEVNLMSARIFPTVPYAPYVHGVGGATENVRGVQLRPWLDFVKEDKEAWIRALEDRLLSRIVGELAK